MQSRHFIVYFKEQIRVPDLTAALVVDDDGALAGVNKPDESQFEDALALVEDESDVLAARELKAEVKADIAEFSEEVNVCEAPMASGEDGEEAANSTAAAGDMNKLENEFKLIETEVCTMNFCFLFSNYYGVRV